MHDHDLIGQLDRPHVRVDDLHARVDALDTWRRWADGDPINVSELAAAVQTLCDPKLRNVSPGYQRLGNTVSRWASDAGLELHLVQPARTMSHHGLELGL